MCKRHTQSSVHKDKKHVVGSNQITASQQIGVEYLSDYVLACSPCGGNQQLCLATRSRVCTWPVRGPTISSAATNGLTYQLLQHRATFIYIARSGTVTSHLSPRWELSQKRFLT
eukprot:gb/GEZN01019359.1/.p1 GENE.gb/GEZN01019359.1/~~gb/GEZN01019359.1/.p1  ORF type:complete len:114 (-),score=0.17 gb/GEZN01019359.1/:27-368(-)